MSAEVFSYHRSLSPTLGVVLALGFVETLVVHLVAMAYWGWRVALPLGLLDIGVLALLIRLLISLRRQPVTLEASRLTLRTGHKLAIEVNTADIAGFREHWTAPDLKAPDLLNMALVEWPNVLFDLRTPVYRSRKPITAVAHKLDDPAAFRRAVERAILE